MTAPETPTSVEERVRTSVALAELRGEVAELKGIAQASDGRLAELVTLSKARDARDAAAEARAAEIHAIEVIARRATAEAELEERRARWAWVRSLVPARALERAAIALASAIGTAILGAAGFRAVGAPAEPTPTHAAGPPPQPPAQFEP